MGHPLEVDVIGQPTRWMLVFDREAKTWWANFIAFGRYKHVRAFGYVHIAGAYLFYDVQFGQTTLQIARGEGARALIAAWTANSDVLAMNAGKTPAYGSGFFRPLICTTSIAHLIGLSGALRPAALYRQCLRNGAEIVHGRTKGTTGAARPDAGPADADGVAPANHCPAG